MLENKTKTLKQYKVKMNITIDSIESFIKQYEEFYKTDLDSAIKYYKIIEELSKSDAHKLLFPDYVVTNNPEMPEEISKRKQFALKFISQKLINEWENSVIHKIEIDEDQDLLEVESLIPNFSHWI